jgi:diguanylate cyclase (GGDEF)-like protein
MGCSEFGRGRQTLAPAGRVIPISLRHSLTMRAVSWLCVAGLMAVLCFLAVFSLVTQRGVAAHSRGADQANQLAAVYADARFWVGQEESLERKYRLEPGADVLTLHDEAEAAVVHDLAHVATLDTSTATQRFLVSVHRAHSGYVRASKTMFRAVDAHQTARVIRLDHELVDPVFGAVQTAVYARSTAAAGAALRQSANLRHEQGAAARTISVAFAIGLLLIAAFGGILISLRRRLAGAWQRELATLAELATTDALTGLRNHRVFQEDLTRAVTALGRSTAQLSLVLLDLDALKIINDTLGHQEGDKYIKAVADGMRATTDSTEGLYRIGGDEFALILPGEAAWEATELIERLRFKLAAVERPISVSLSAGVANAQEYRHQDALIREADLALRAAKRGQQAVVTYTPTLDNDDPFGPNTGRAHRGTLANALALAVDAKDSYTRSHCQTVSQLCALVAAELGLSPDRVVRMRLAGLLHDVGKIGVPDAILNKPSRLDDTEFAQMQRHATLGGDIVAAADLAEESHWIRHHHERYDGAGYPDGIQRDEIPLESRIILACDAYEAMTSNRPYRKAPGHAFAIAELKKHAGTQFDPEVVDALCNALATRAAEPEGGGQRELAEAA